jgi:hypothetical protein
VLAIRLRGSCMLNKHCTTELHPQFFYLLKFSIHSIFSLRLQKCLRFHFAWW